MTVQIINGDCLEILAGLDEGSMHASVTSPPYFGLRDYGLQPTDWPDVVYEPMAGMPPVAIPAMRCCLGLEPDPLAYIGHVVLVFRHVRRSLRDDGTLWLNLGDSYATSGGPGWQGKNGQRADRRFTGTRDTVPMREQSRTACSAHKPKDLLGIPWRAAFALQADGWFLRQDVIWAKPNPMPESVTDRCTKSHEYIFLLSKSAQYYFDQEAISEPLAAASVERLSQATLATQAGSDRVPGKTNGTMKAVRRSSGNKERKPGTARGCPEGTGSNVCGSVPWEGDTRNKRSVWNVPTQPFREAHFATFPPALVEPCILAGCPEGGAVLDPFGGAGTTGLVADRLHRNATLIELNPEYASMARRRILGDAPLLVEIAA